MKYPLLPLVVVVPLFIPGHMKGSIVVSVFLIFWEAGVYGLLVDAGMVHAVLSYQVMALIAVCGQLDQAREDFLQDANSWFLPNAMLLVLVL